MASTEQEIYQALTNAGLSQIQAAGVMGNMQNESSFNIESAAMDTNGAMSYGLISWNQASYPGASSLVTGNPTKDLADQVNFLLHDTSGTTQGLKGSTAAQVAGNWANFVEVCQGCTPGGAQNVQRQANANNILREARSGNWGSGGPGISGSGNNAQTASLFSSAGLPFPFDVPGIIGGLIGGSTGSLTSGIGEGIASGFTSAFADITNTMLQKLGFTGWKDFFIRMGLIGLGVVILIIGLTHLTEKNGPTISLSSPTASGGGESESAEETSRETSGKSGNSGPRSNHRNSTHSSSNSPKTTGGRVSGNKVKTGVSSATHKFGSEAGELAEAAIVA